MGKIIQSKKFSLILAFWGLLASADMVFGEEPFDLEAKTAPIFIRAGVLPTSIENETKEPLVASFVEELKTLFPRVVKESNRFQVLGEQRVLQKWQTQAGQEELIKNDELNIFAHLTIVIHPSKLLLIARLLYPISQILLQETLSLPLTLDTELSKETALKSLKDIFFALVNQLPHDIYVTSIQIPYITLSGGLTQGLQVGDLIKLTRVWPKKRHVATGAWIDFKIEPIGQAKIVERRDHVAIAELLQLEVANKISLGDGASLMSLASRNYFFSQTKVSSTNLEDSILVK